MYTSLLKQFIKLQLEKKKNIHIYSNQETSVVNFIGKNSMYLPTWICLGRRK